MLTIRIFDAKGRLAARMDDVPDDATPSLILDHITQTELEDPRALKIRVENEAGKGYWILLGELKTPEIEHPRRQERRN